MLHDLIPGSAKDQHGSKIAFYRVFREVEFIEKRHEKFDESGIRA